MKTAIVIGATGLVGKALIQKLIADPSFSKITAITRKPLNIINDKLNNRVINFDQLASCSAYFTGDVLFSCLGTTKKQAGSIIAQRKVDVDYQYQAAMLAADNHVRHYILVSSSGANATSRNDYLRMKGELEDNVTLLNFEKISILRPSLLLGERDHIRVGERIGAYLLPTLCKLPFLKRYRPISGEQVALKMINVYDKQQVHYQDYTLTELFERD